MSGLTIRIWDVGLTTHTNTHTQMFILNAADDQRVLNNHFRLLSMAPCSDHVELGCPPRSESETI
jgi:hypothetical protein